MRLKRTSFGCKRGAKGFTILELLVATLVFSVVLLVVTSGILQIARVYYKGVTESSTQNAARGIIDAVSQAIQFSGGDVTETDSMTAPGVNYAFCVGDQRFSFRLGWQVKDNPAGANQTWHAIVQDTSDTCPSATAQTLTNQTLPGRDLLGQNMRLSKLSVDRVGATEQYRVTVRVVYGDNDLLNNPTASDSGCMGVRAGTQFCSVSELSTVVVKRVE